MSRGGDVSANANRSGEVDLECRSDMLPVEQFAEAALPLIVKRRPDAAGLRL